MGRLGQQPDSEIRTLADQPAAVHINSPTPFMTKLPPKPKTPEHVVDHAAMEDTLDGLTHTEQLFVAEYMLDRNAARAYRETHPYVAESTARKEGSVWSRKPHIKTAIERRAAIMLSSLEVTSERVMKEMARIGFANVSDLFRSDGSPRQINELPPDVSAAVSSFEASEMWDGTGKERTHVGRMYKVKLHPKMEALKVMAQHLGLLNPDATQQAESPATAMADLKAFYDEVMAEASQQRSDAEQRSAAIEAMAAEIAAKS